MCSRRSGRPVWSGGLRAGSYSTQMSSKLFGPVSKPTFTIGLASSSSRAARHQKSRAWNASPSRRPVTACVIAVTLQGSASRASVPERWCGLSCGRDLDRALEGNRPIRIGIKHERWQEPLRQVGEGEARRALAGGSGDLHQPINLRCVESRLAQRTLNHRAPLNLVGAPEFEYVGGTTLHRRVDSGKAVGAEDHRRWQALLRQAIYAADEGVDASAVLVVHLSIFAALGQRVGFIDEQDDAAAGLAGRALQLLRRLQRMVERR